jgi:hypothetical protein
VSAGHYLQDFRWCMLLGTAAGDCWAVLGTNMVNMGCRDLVLVYPKHTSGQQHFPGNSYHEPELV